MEKISFDTNNGRRIELRQESHDRTVTMCAINDKGVEGVPRKIPASDFVMLLNLYWHIKETNEYNLYVNPTGIRYK